MSDYTRIELTDAPDILGDYPGEMRFLTGPLEAEQAALTYRRMPPGTGGRGSYGHRHKTQEELYLVVEGTLTFKIGDDVFEAGPGTAVRIPPSSVRSVHNDSDSDVILIMTSTKADDYDGEVEFEQDFWPN
ncbi:MAG TPA: cupin domain-containing protein [Thermoleophilaceae bacterium]|nr:cupin domain-containing protein [Thermoleophilaceae bacterium]